MLWSMLVACVATSEPAPPADDTDAAPPTSLAPTGCSDAAVTVRTDGEDLVAETAGVRLVVRAGAVPEDEARTLARIADAARDAWRAHFEGGPADDTVLEAVLTPDAGTFGAAIAADGDDAPPDAAGFYSPVSGRSYAWVQPTRYYTRVLLVHELTHQWHFAARVGGRPMPWWYVEGVAEHLSRHDWDGRCVTLGVTTLAEQDDPLDAALLDLPDTDEELERRLTADDFPSRAAAMAWWRYLDRNRPAFRSWRLDADAAAVGYDTVAEAVPLDGLARGLEAWLERAQSPLSPVFVEWLPLAADRIEGWAEFSSALRWKGSPPEVFRATHAAPQGDALAGLVVSYDDPANLQLLLVDAAGSVRTLTFTDGDGRFETVGAVEPTDADWTWALENDAGQGEVTLGEHRFVLDLAFAPAAGLSLYAGTTTFSGVSPSAEPDR